MDAIERADTRECLLVGVDNPAGPPMPRGVGNAITDLRGFRLHKSHKCILVACQSDALVSFRERIRSIAHRAFLRTSGSGSSATCWRCVKAAASAISPRAAAASLRKLACSCAGSVRCSVASAILRRPVTGSTSGGPARSRRRDAQSARPTLGPELARAHRLGRDFANHPVVVGHGAQSIRRRLQIGKRKRADRGTAHMRVGIGGGGVKAGIASSIFRKPITPTAWTRTEASRSCSAVSAGLSASVRRNSFRARSAAMRTNAWSCDTSGKISVRAAGSLNSARLSAAAAATV